MFDFLAEIADAIWTGIKGLWTMCKRIIKAVISFVHDLVDGLFEILEDIFGDDVPSSVDESPVKPFIGDMDKLIDNAPTKDVGLFKQKKKNFIRLSMILRTSGTTRTARIHTTITKHLMKFALQHINRLQVLQFWLTKVSL